MLEHLQIGIVLSPSGHYSVIYERGEHLRLEEAGEERAVPLRLVREERGFVEVDHGFAGR